MMNEIMILIGQEAVEKMKQRNWVLVEPYFDEEMNLAGLRGYLELEEGGLQIGDRVCLHNDSTPGSNNQITGTVVGETPFHYIIEAGNSQRSKEKKECHRRCVNKTSLLSSYTLEMEAARKRLERKLKQKKTDISDDDLAEALDCFAYITSPTMEMLEKIN